MLKTPVIIRRWSVMGLIATGIEAGVLAFLLAAMVLAGFPRHVHAQQSGLALSPAIFEAVLDPGESKVQVIRLKNPTGSAISVKASIRPFANQQGARPADGYASIAFDASGWFNLDANEFILRPNEEREVKLTINPPATAEPGGHYATIMFTPLQPEAAARQNTAYLASEVGSLAFLTVRGDIRESARVLPPAKPTVYQAFGPARVTFEYKNDGNVHHLTAATFKITGLRGREIGRQTSGPQVVLPDTIQAFPVNWGRQWLPYRYTITPEFTFGTPPQTVTGQPVTVWIVPWLPLSILVIIALGGLIFAIKTRRRWAPAWRAFRGKTDS